MNTHANVRRCPGSRRTLMLLDKAAAAGLGTDFDFEAAVDGGVRGSATLIEPSGAGRLGEQLSLPSASLALASLILHLWGARLRFGRAPETLHGCRVAFEAGCVPRPPSNLFIFFCPG